MSPSFNRVCELKIRERIAQARAAEREACAKIAREEAAVASKNGWVEYLRAAHNIQVKILGRGNAVYTRGL